MEGTAVIDTPCEDTYGLSATVTSPSASYRARTTEGLADHRRYNARVHPLPVPFPARLITGRRIAKSLTPPTLTGYPSRLALLTL